MRGFEYQSNAMRTNDGKSFDRLSLAIARNAIRVGGPDVAEVLNACLGLSGEIGELNDMIKKVVYHEATFDEEHAKKELGDVMWYVAQMCDAMGWNLDEIMEMNIDKLHKRYPDGFDPEKSKHRKESDV